MSAAIRLRNERGALRINIKIYQTSKGHQKQSSRCAKLFSNHNLGAIVKKSKNTIIKHTLAADSESTDDVPGKWGCAVD